MELTILFLLTIIIPICVPLPGIVNINLIQNKCFRHSIGQIIRCQLTFQDEIERSIHERPYFVNMSAMNEQEEKFICCGLWDMISCMRGAAIKWSNCKQNTLKMFIKDIEGVAHHRYYDVCLSRFKEGSIKCGFPVWATVTLVVISVVVIAAVTCFVHRICRQRTRAQDSISLITH